MSRVIIRDLFAEARKLKAKSRRVDLRWLGIQRTCIRKLGHLESESFRIARELNKIMRKLEKCGYSMLEIHERIKPVRTKRK